MPHRSIQATAAVCLIAHLVFAACAHTPPQRPHGPDEYIEGTASLSVGTSDSAIPALAIRERGHLIVVVRAGTAANPPVGGAYVRLLRDTLALDASGEIGNMRTSEEGRAALVNVPAGRYGAMVTALGYDRLTGDVTVRPGYIDTVHAELRIHFQRIPGVYFDPAFSGAGR